MFLHEGCNVTICSSSSEKISIAAKELEHIENGNLFFTKCNINNPEEIEITVNTAVNRFGNIDILVNNCGGPTPGFFDDLSEENWENAYDQVLMSAVRFTKLVLPNMKKNNWGRIINISSISVKQPIDNLLLSNTFRSGLTAFSKTLSNQVGKHNITINNVAPGLTLTNRLDELAELRAKDSSISKEEMLKRMAEDIPLKRLAKPEEIAAIVVFLASVQGSYINGQTIVADGGFNKSTY
jgi:3-oxoacyl-[acyl-carrier protein] reductase